MSRGDWLPLGLAAVVVALAAGAGVMVFKWMYEGLGDAAHWLEPIGTAGILLLPVVGGLVVGLISRYLIGVERHHGVAGIMEAVALGGGRLRFWRIPQKMIAAAASIGCGASVGPEDPSVQIGANFGSMIGQALHLSEERIRTLVAAGAAGGIAAAFNAPIAGVFFALEIIIGEIGGSHLGLIVLASVVSAAFTRSVAGLKPEFSVPAYALHSPWELPLYLLLGLAAGVVSAAYIRGVMGAGRFFRHLRVPRWTKPAIGGLVVGIVALRLPEVRGVGYETVTVILRGVQANAWLLLAFVAGKLLLTPISTGSGFLGGVFAPALFLGAALGGAFGHLASAVFPVLGLDAPAFGMVGMAAVLAGAVRCPLTATLLLFEMTDDYRIILPVLLAVVVSQGVSRRLQRESVYTAQLASKGIRLEHGRDVDVLEGIMVSEVMRTQFSLLRDTDSLQKAIEILSKIHRNGLPVVDANDDLYGILTVGDIERAHAAGATDDMPLGPYCTREVIVTYPDEPIGDALRRMAPGEVGRLPVVSRDDPKKVVGLLRRTDLVRAYDAALSRRAAARQRAAQTRIGILGGVEIEETLLEKGAPAAGRVLKDMSWPPQCVIATIRRHHRLVVPRGETRLEAGDVLLLVGDRKAREAAQQLCKKPDGSP
jgi:CIC family chloride channel protein